ncbi:MAG: nucleic acid-binding protein [Treponema sp.]|nr:nucleic acid-binding protein [Treponema sp.]
MVMTEIFDKLKSLQDVLAEKYALETKIEDAPKQLTAQDELVARLKKEYINKNQVYEELRSKVLALKAELEETEKIREQGEAGMDNITTHREYEALDKQISEASAKEQELRKELSGQEKDLTNLQEDLKADEEMIASSEADLNNSKQSLNQQLADYQEKLADLNKQEEEITPGLDPEIVYKFQRIIQRNDKGIVAVKRGVCEGCHMILPAQFANEVREGEKILFCPYCSRILYYQEVEDGEDNTGYFMMDDAGSLADLDDDYSDEDEDLLEDDDLLDDSDLEDESDDDEDEDDEDEGLDDDDPSSDD